MSMKENGRAERWRADRLSQTAKRVSKGKVLVDSQIASNRAAKKKGRQGAGRQLNGAGQVRR